MTISVQIDQLIQADPDLAWYSLQQHLSLLHEDLPNIRHIRELTRQSGSPVTVQYGWGIDPAVVPAVARPFLRNLLDEVQADTHWHAAERRVSFMFYSDGLRSLFQCEGEFLLHPADGHTRMEVKGVIDVAPHELPGIPKLLSRSILPAVERVVEDSLTPSLSALPGALEKLIRRHANLPA